MVKEKGPDWALVVVPVPPPPVPPPVVEVFPPHPTAVRTATERTTASNPAQRRRRGSVSRSMQASVAPEPAAYQGALPDGWCWNGVSPGWTNCAVVVWEALTMNEVVTPVAEVMLTGVTENEGVTAPRLWRTAVMVTAPVNPLTGVMVKTTPVEVAPAATATLPVQGVMEKSFWVEETKSMEAKVESAASRVPLEPA